MTVNLSAPENLLPVDGIRLASAATGIKKNGKTDMVLIELEAGSVTAGTFTRNRFRAAPVQLCEKHLSLSKPRLLMINSGNANAGTGEAGMQAAEQTCEIAANALGCKPEQVLPFSTGVIGEHLPVSCFEKSLPALVSKLGRDNWIDAANGIMTTDTVAKGISRQVSFGDTVVTVTGIAKGSGMIKPDMATMLAYIATDAAVDNEALTKCLTQAVNLSFNSITVDGDTSTNDSCILVATGKAGNDTIVADSSDYIALCETVTEVCQFLAMAIIRDAEGINRFVEIRVNGATSTSDAREIAYTIAHSPLVKTAVFAGDPNWGRILAAVGRARIDKLDIDALKIYLDDVCIVENGGRSPHYTEAAGQQVMSQTEIVITVELNQGDSSATIWTSDLSYDYVKINAEYRT